MGQKDKDNEEYAYRWSRSDLSPIINSTHKLANPTR